MKTLFFSRSTRVLILLASLAVPARANAPTAPADPAAAMVPPPAGSPPGGAIFRNFVDDIKNRRSLSRPPPGAAGLQPDPAQDTQTTGAVTPAPTPGPGFMPAPPPPIVDFEDRVIRIDEAQRDGNPEAVRRQLPEASRDLLDPRMTEVPADIRNRY